MSRFTPEFIKKIREQVDIREVIGEHVVLKKHGNEFVGLCPFHGEKTPSFSVNPSKHFFFCHGCKKGGDTLNFLQEIHGLDFTEAVQELADRAGIKIDAPSKDPNADAKLEAFREKQRLAARLNRYIAKVYKKFLEAPGGKKAREYATSRGVTPELLEEFYLGFAPANWDDLGTALANAKAPLALARELGVIRPSTKRENSDIDLFRDRLLFPILDLRGRVQGFGGRTLSDETPKFLNSSDSFFFHKSQSLYGLFQAQKHLREEGQAILVEGYFDVLVLHAKGFKSTLATCGTALTPDHLKILRKLTDHVTIVFDGDKAGVQATEKAMETGLQMGLFLRGVDLPTGYDPDQFLMEEGGIEKFRELLADARPILETQIRHLSEQAKSGPEQKTLALKKCTHWLSLISDPIAKEVWSQEIRKAFGMAEVRNSAIFGNAPPPSFQKPFQRPAPQGRPLPPKKEAPLLRGDLILLQALVRYADYGEIWSQALKELPGDTHLSELWESTVCKNWTAKVLHQVGVLGKIGDFPEYWLDPELPGEIRSTLAEALASSAPPVSLQGVSKALAQALSRVWAQFSQTLRSAVHEAERAGQAGEVERLLQEILDVQRKIKDFKRFYDQGEFPESG